jgi:hypothetical protein
MLCCNDHLPNKTKKEKQQIEVLIAKEKGALYTSRAPFTLRDQIQPDGALMSIYFTFILAFFMNTSKFTGRLIITLYALKLGAQPFTVGVLVAMSEVLPTLLSWHVGRLSDRFGARWLLMVGAAAGALGMLVSYVWFTACTLRGSLTKHRRTSWRTAGQGQKLQ